METKSKFDEEIATLANQQKEQSQKKSKLLVDRKTLEAAVNSKSLELGKLHHSVEVIPLVSHRPVHVISDIFGSISPSIPSLIRCILDLRGPHQVAGRGDARLRRDLRVPWLRQAPSKCEAACRLQHPITVVSEKGLILWFAFVNSRMGPFFKC